MMGSNFIALSLAIILNAVIEQPQPIEGATLDTQYMYVRQGKYIFYSNHRKVKCNHKYWYLCSIFSYFVIDPIQYWVDDGCVTGGRDKDGSFKKTTDLAGVRCCSDDGSTCETPGDCPAHNMPFDNAKQKCAQLGKRLCTKDQLLSGVCCGTGGMCDYDAIWTSDIGKNHFHFDKMSNTWNKVNLRYNLDKIWLNFYSWNLHGWPSESRRNRSWLWRTVWRMPNMRRWHTKSRRRWNWLRRTV